MTIIEKIIIWIAHYSRQMNSHLWRSGDYY